MDNVMSPQQTMEQKRAASAWRQVGSVTEYQDKYGSWARKLPELIRANGLAAAMAFLISKGGGYVTLYEHLSEWLIRSYLCWTEGDLLEVVHSESVHMYRRLTAEAIEYAIWLRRYAQAKDMGSEESRD